jgi:hypothetical protein
LHARAKGEWDGNSHGEQKCGEDHVGRGRTIPLRVQQWRIHSVVGPRVGYQDHADYCQASKYIERYQPSVSSKSANELAFGEAAKVMGLRV